MIDFDSLRLMQGSVWLCLSWKYETSQILWYFAIIHIAGEFESQNFSIKLLVTNTSYPSQLLVGFLPCLTFALLQFISIQLILCFKFKSFHCVQVFLTSCPTPTSFNARHACRSTLYVLSVNRISQNRAICQISIRGTCSYL